MAEITYQLQYSARRSISIKILDDNTVVVRAPFGCSKERIDGFVSSKMRWIERHVAENASKNSILSEVIDYKKVLVAGVPVSLTISYRNCLSFDAVCVKSLKNLKKLYVDVLGSEFLRTFNEVVDSTGLKCASVGFKDYKSRWGCCDASGNILFNYKLLMLDEKFWRYVALHELCHTVFMDHSQNFYSLMSKYMPDYKTLREEMKLYSPLTALY